MDCETLKELSKKGEITPSSGNSDWLVVLFLNKTSCSICVISWILGMFQKLKINLATSIF